VSKGYCQQRWRRVLSGIRRKMTVLAGGENRRLQEGGKVAVPSQSTQGTTSGATSKKLGCVRKDQERPTYRLTHQGAGRKHWKKNLLNTTKSLSSWRKRGKRDRPKDPRTGLEVVARPEKTAPGEENLGVKLETINKRRFRLRGGTTKKKRGTKYD